MDPVSAGVSSAGVPTASTPGAIQPGVSAPILQAGSSIDVQVLRALGAGRFLIALGDRQLVADSDTELKPGSQVRMQVAASAGDSLILRLAASVTTSLSDATQRLSSSGLPSTAAAAAVLAAFEEAGAPLIPARLQAALADATVSQQPQQTATAHALLARVQLPATPALVRLAARAATGTLPDLGEALRDLATTVRANTPAASNPAPPAVADRGAAMMAAPAPRMPIPSQPLATATNAPAAPPPQAPKHNAAVPAVPAAPATAASVPASIPASVPLRAPAPPAPAHPGEPPVQPTHVRPSQAQSTAPRATIVSTPPTSPGSTRPGFPPASADMTASATILPATARAAPSTATGSSPAAPPTISSHPRADPTSPILQTPTAAVHIRAAPAAAPAISVPPVASGAAAAPPPATTTVIAAPTQLQAPSSRPPAATPFAPPLEVAGRPPSAVANIAGSGQPPVMANSHMPVMHDPLPTTAAAVATGTTPTARSPLTLRQVAQFVLPDPARDGAPAVLRALAMAGIRPAAASPTAASTSTTTAPANPLSTPVLPTAQALAMPAAVRQIASMLDQTQVATPGRPDTAAPARPDLQPSTPAASTTPPATPPAPPPHGDTAPQHASSVPPPVSELEQRTVQAMREHLADQVFKPKELADYDRVVPLPLAANTLPTPARLAVATRSTGGGVQATFIRVDAELSRLGSVSLRLSGADSGGPLAITLVASPAAGALLADELPALIADLRAIGVEAGVRVVSDG